MKYNRQTIQTAIRDSSHMMVMTVKVSVEIQDGWRKDAQRIRNVEVNCGKLSFSFRECLLFHITFFSMNVKM